MYWKTTPRVKIYEALGAIADGRIEVNDEGAKVYSSSKGKFYTIQYDPDTGAIMVNDNASFYLDYLGYPAIAYLMLEGKIDFDSSVTKYLKDISWKDINQKFKNDFEKAAEFALADLDPADREKLEKEIDRVYDQIKDKKFKKLGEKTQPPKGY